MKYIMVSFSDYCNSVFIDRVPYKQKLAASWEPGCVKCSKTFCKIFATQNMPNQTNAKHSSNSEDIFKSTKNVLETTNSKEDSSNCTTSKVLSKIPNRKNF